MKGKSIIALLLLGAIPALAAKAQALTFTYSALLDHNGNTIQSWSGINAYSAFLSDSGTVWYTGGSAGMGGSCMVAAGWGNIYEKDWNGNTLRTITTAQLGGGMPHHAINLTARGTILAIVAESYNGACGERIVEFDPAQNKVIWSWHTGDHEGSGAAKLQRGNSSSDPYHMNNVDWDPVSNKLVISAHNTYEVYVIDRSIDSTAAKGTAGDIQWRIGNPSKYGVSGATQIISYAVHSARWVKPGITGAGNIVFYANISPANSNYSTGYEVRPIYAKRSNGEWDYEIVFKGTNSSTVQANTGGMDKLFNGNWLISFSNSKVAYEFDAGGGVTQTSVNAVGQWSNPGQNGLRRYPLCYGAIRAGMLKGDAEATAHYNTYCLSMSSSSANQSSSAVSSSSTPVSSSSAISSSSRQSSSSFRSSSSQGPVMLAEAGKLRENEQIALKSGVLYVKLPAAAEIAVTDAIGVIRLRKYAGAGESWIATENWPKGLYWVSVRGYGWQALRRVWISQ